MSPDGDTDDMPAPNMPLESPVIQTILQAWTKDRNNLNFFNAWCKQVLKEKNLSRLQKGVELLDCSQQAKDGLLTMVVPMLRARPEISVTVFTREKVQIRYDMRLKVTENASNDAQQ